MHAFVYLSCMNALTIPFAALPPVVRDHILSLSLRDGCDPVKTVTELLRTAAQRRLAPLEPQMQPQPEGTGRKAVLAA
jgi:hypothetical protein